MIRSFREIENSYIENFSVSEDKGDHIIFRDEKLPDMHAFNCILVKENMERGHIENFVRNKLDQAKSEGRDFLKIIFDPGIEINDSLLKCMSDIGFEADINLYMKIDGSQAAGFRANENCIVKIARTEEELEAGRQHDIETTSPEVPKEFTKRKTLRKKEVFQEANKELYSYLCHRKNDVIGKCELHIKGDYAKIEDFDVLENCQRRGFGTAILKKIISDVVSRGINNIYLITGKDDTPREMYSKLGFEIIGEELEILWRE